MKTISNIILVLLMLSCSNRKTEEISQLEGNLNRSYSTVQNATTDSIQTVDYSNVLLLSQPLKERIVLFVDDVFKYYPGTKDRKEFGIEIINQDENNLILSVSYIWPGSCSSSYIGILDFTPKDIVIFLYQKKGELNESFFKLIKNGECIVEKETIEGSLLILNGGYRVEPYTSILANISTLLHFKKVNGKFEFYKLYRDPKTVPKL